MNKTTTLLLFLFAIRSCLAQMPATPAQLRAWFEHQPLDTPGQTGFLSSEPTVSVARLRHHTPDKAWAAFHRSLKLANARGYQQGVMELQKALAIDPDKDPDNRLVTLVEQRRARALLTQLDSLFVGLGSSARF